MENVIKNINIIESTYKNDNWIEYEIGNFKGYELDEVDLGMEREIEKKYNGDEMKKKLLNKISIDKCSEFLRYLVIECSRCENDMLFVEHDELIDMGIDGDIIDSDLVNELEEEIARLDIDGYIEYDYHTIIVHGGIITEFLFDIPSLQGY